MKALVLIGIFAGIVLCASPEIIKWLFSPNPQILEVEPFWKVNGSYANEGEIFEVFDPPLDRLANITDDNP
jgi:hypothetical protein